MMNNRKSPSKNPRVFYIVFAAILGLVVLGAVMTPLITIAAFIGGAALSGGVCFAYYKLWLSKQIEYLSEENERLRLKNAMSTTALESIASRAPRLLERLHSGQLEAAEIAKYLQAVEVIGYQQDNIQRHDIFQ